MNNRCRLSRHSKDFSSPTDNFPVLVGDDEDEVVVADEEREHRESIPSVLLVVVVGCLFNSLFWRKDKDNIMINTHICSVHRVV